MPEENLKSVTSFGVGRKTGVVKDFGCGGHTRVYL